MKKIVCIIVSLIILVSVCGCIDHITIEEESSTDEFASEILEAMDIFNEPESITAVELATQVTTTKPENTTKVKIVETTTEELTTEPPAEYYEDLADEYDYDYNEGDVPGDYIGLFELTAYEWTGNPMANGQYPYYGACASTRFPKGTRLYIEGYGTFTVCDTGNLPYNVIDIYLGDPDECDAFGRKFDVRVYYA